MTDPNTTVRLTIDQVLADPELRALLLASPEWQALVAKIIARGKGRDASRESALVWHSRFPISDETSQRK